MNNNHGRLRTTASEQRRHGQKGRGAGECQSVCPSVCLFCLCGVKCAARVDGCNGRARGEIRIRGRGDPCCLCADAGCKNGNQARSGSEFGMRVCPRENPECSWKPWAGMN
jgi:hypothetical protein